MDIPPVKTFVLAAAALVAVTGAPSGYCQRESRTVFKTPISAKTDHTASIGGGQFAAAYTAYIDRLRAKLDNKWYLADGRNKVNLSVTVSGDGSATNLQLTSSPRNIQAEQAASDAFNQSQPLAALPAGSPPVKLVLVFDSDANPHGNNNRYLTATMTPIECKTSPPEAATPGAGTNSARDDAANTKAKP